ncbi:MAG: glutamyl-tRNA reductase [Candidatus Omnitrophota bacterium]|nr:glutamyl-tRNA reductase [Candidatus Omnitrophota bacterium]
MILIGINYNQANLFTREKFSFSKKESELFIARLISQGMAKGVVILSTCLRFEIYAENTDAAILKDCFLGFKNAGPEFLPYFYTKQNEEAVLHLFTVAAGLDSQVIGENEILHQIKQAYFMAGSLEATTPLLNRLFQRALFAGKAVRSETGISNIDPSIALSAVELAESLLGPVKNKRIGIIGAGSIAQKIAQLCANREALCILVANRTFLKAKEIAEKVKGKAVKFNKFYGLIESIDILFSATASRHFILNKEIFDLKHSSDRPLVIIDLAFPRDIDPEIGNRKGVKLFNLDNFKQVNYARAKQLLLARELVKEKAANFWKKERLSGYDFAGWQQAEFIGQRAS